MIKRIRTLDIEVMMKFLLDLIYFFYAAFYLPILRLKGKWHKDFSMRLAQWSDFQIALVKGDANIWIHAVSVGEVRVIEEIIIRIRKQFGKCHIILSTVTTTGNNLAQEMFSQDQYIQVIYAPIDFSGVVAKYVQWIKPKVYIAAETEIWPNLFMELKKCNVPLLIINGRISDQSYEKYKIIGWLLKRILPLVDRFCMQSLVDQDRIISLGARPEAVKVMGNLKFDKQFKPGSFSRSNLHITDDAPLWIAASTHPGEEEIILEVYKLLYEDYQDMRLIIAPRHVDRAENICSLIEEQGFGARRLSSKVTEKGRGVEIIVVDTIGDLASLYNIADIVFMGKSLVPGGGQNMIEPALLSKPVIIGPNTENFKDVVRIFLKDQAMLEVKDAKQLQDRIVMLMNDPQKCKKIGEAAFNVCEQNRGATDDAFQEIKTALEISFK